VDDLPLILFVRALAFALACVLYRVLIQVVDRL
jgi:hypothetical protein